MNLFLSGFMSWEYEIGEGHIVDQRKRKTQQRMIINRCGLVVCITSPTEESSTR